MRCYKQWSVKLRLLTVGLPLLIFLIGLTDIFIRFARITLDLTLGLGIQDLDRMQDESGYDPWNEDRSASYHRSH
jgi:hypothetical protein